MYNTAELEIFGLKKNHVKLINFFVNKVGKEFTAREISREVGIPISRIYPYLNDLVFHKLIVKKESSKTLFAMIDPELRFREFLNRKNLELKELQKTILDSLPSFASHNFILAKSTEEFYQIVYQIIKNAKSAKILSHTPFLILTTEKLGYWGTQLQNSYKQRIGNKELEFYYLVDNNFLKDKVVKKNKEIVMENIEWLNNQNNVNLRTHDLSNAVSMVITDNDVVVGFSNPKERKIARGILFRSNELVDFFENIYDNLFQEAQEIKSA